MRAPTLPGPRRSWSRSQEGEVAPFSSPGGGNDSAAPLGDLPQPGAQPPTAGVPRASLPRQASRSAPEQRWAQSRPVGEGRLLRPGPALTPGAKRAGHKYLGRRKPLAGRLRSLAALPIPPPQDTSSQGNRQFAVWKPPPSGCCPLESPPKQQKKNPNIVSLSCHTQQSLSFFLC